MARAAVPIDIVRDLPAPGFCFETRSLTFCVFIFRVCFIGMRGASSSSRVPVSCSCQLLFLIARVGRAALSLSFVSIGIGCRNPGWCEREKILSLSPLVCGGQQHTRACGRKRRCTHSTLPSLNLLLPLYGTLRPHHSSTHSQFLWFHSFNLAL